MIEREDEEHLAFATTAGRVLYRFNVGDYCRLNDQVPTHAGLILAQQQRFSVGDQMRRLMRLLASLSTEEMRNRIEFLSAWS